MKIKAPFVVGLFLLIGIVSSCHKQDLQEQKKLYTLLYEDEYQSCKDIFRSIQYRTKHDNLTSKGKIAPQDSLRLAITEEYVSDFDSSFSKSKVGLLVDKMDEYLIQRGRKDHALRFHMNLLYSKLKSSEDSIDYLQMKIVLVKILKMQLEDLSLEISGNYTQRWFSMMNYNNEIVSEENCVVGDTVRMLLFPPKNDLNGNWCRARPIKFSITHKESTQSIQPIAICAIKSGVFIQFSPPKKGNYDIKADVEYFWNNSFDYEDDFGQPIDLRGFKDSTSFSRTIPVRAKGQKVVKKKIVVPRLID